MDSRSQPPPEKERNRATPPSMPSVTSTSRRSFSASPPLPSVAPRPRGGLLQPGVPAPLPRPPPGWRPHPRALRRQQRLQSAPGLHAVGAASTRTSSSPAGATGTSSSPPPRRRRRRARRMMSHAHGPSSCAQAGRMG